MNGKWLYVVLALSLAVHVGFLSVFVARKARDWKWRRDYERKWLKPGHHINEVTALFDQYTALNARRDTAAYWQARRALGRMGLAPTYDSTELERALDVLMGGRRTRHRNRYLLLRGLRELNSDRWNQGIRKWEARADSERLRDDSIWQVRLAEHRQGRGAR
jgi:hypothetical protein